MRRVRRAQRESEKARVRKQTREWWCDLRYWFGKRVKSRSSGRRCEKTTICTKSCCTKSVWWCGRSTKWEWFIATSSQKTSWFHIFDWWTTKSIMMRWRWIWYARFFAFFSTDRFRIVDSARSAGFVSNSCFDGPMYQVIRSSRGFYESVHTGFFVVALVVTS